MRDKVLYTLGTVALLIVASCIIHVSLFVFSNQGKDASYVFRNNRPIALSRRIPEFQIIEGVPDYTNTMKVFSKNRSCAVIASASILGYLDNNGYQDLIPEGGNLDSDLDYLSKGLYREIGCNFGLGAINHKITSGIEAYARKHGYVFECAVKPITWLNIKEEITAGRPFLLKVVLKDYGMENHMVVVIGLSEKPEKAIVVLDNWDNGSPEHIIEWKAINISRQYAGTAMITVVDSGEKR
ncbi:MAG: hypothetical protein QME06_07930 [Desulfobacterales bacterium]|nr:hypothetical protein [Desulfobacterales bacterium]